MINTYKYYMRAKIENICFFLSYTNFPICLYPLDIDFVNKPY
ncbi:hypothetical protein HMPREF3182_01300 [Megasphaera hutchinsoni]|uniref:Uncharacterized protein n=1 Tax=Megasphaera hutchinsoni TaxID=1588748 RepID=A0A134CEA0_9FIRM|nr:hypothetical protein HMPREF3182_01300 [Megasphaera hutchinsoni]